LIFLWLGCTYWRRGQLAKIFILSTYSWDWYWCWPTFSFYGIACYLDPVYWHQGGKFYRCFDLKSAAPLFEGIVCICSLLIWIVIMQSTRIQSIVTSVNICALIFIIVPGGYLGFKTGWIGYKLPTGYFTYIFLLHYPYSIYVWSQVIEKYWSLVSIIGILHLE